MLRRELRSLGRALAGVPSRSSVLVSPCGSAEHLEAFARRGDHLTCLDPSAIALADAVRYWQEIAKASPTRAPKPAFLLGQPLQTNFPARHFDAVVCTGFFDCLDSSDLRIEAMCELRRVCRGPVIVSFCNAFALGALRVGVARRRNNSRQRVPLPVWALLNDLRRAGLTPVERHAVWWGISPLWHVVSVPASGHASRRLDAPGPALAKAA